jgi:probable rRNA maturation factor
MPRRLAVAVRRLAPGWRRLLPGAGALGRRACHAAFAAAAPDLPAGRRLEITLVLADDATLRRLNQAHRGIDAPTNVLSFVGSGDATGLPPAAPLNLGDVVLAGETMQGEAARQGKALADHFTHLTVHGVLHLLGYDHEKAADARMMESLEIAVLAGLGVADPYRPRRTGR